MEPPGRVTGLKLRKSGLNFCFEGCLVIEKSKYLRRHFQKHPWLPRETSSVSGSKKGRVDGVLFPGVYRCGSQSGRKLGIGICLDRCSHCSIIKLVSKSGHTNKTTQLS